MTFISAVMTDLFLSVTADRRVTRLTPDGSCGQVLDEDTVKIFSVGINGFYSITGAADTAIAIMDATAFLSTVFSRIGIIRNSRLNQWLETNRELLRNEQNSFQLIFGGLTTEGAYKLFDLDSEEGVLESIVRAPILQYKVFSSAHFVDDETLPAQWFEEMLVATPPRSLAHLQQLQSRLNDRGADRDPSVNNRVTEFILPFSD